MQVSTAARGSTGLAGAVPDLADLPDLRGGADRLALDDAGLDDAALDAALDGLDDGALPADPPDAVDLPQVTPPRRGRRRVAALLVVAALAGSGALAAATAPPHLRNAVATAVTDAGRAFMLSDDDLATLPPGDPRAAAARPAPAPVVPAEVLAARERGRASADDSALGLRRAAELLAAGQAEPALQVFTQAVQALALVPADEPRRPALAEQARQVRGRLVSALEQAPAA